jgi:hypothetical protein
VQPDFSGKIIGPTPPDDLFVTPAMQQTAAVPEPAAPAAAPQPAAEPPVPQVYSTAANAPHQPLVLRIELAIVDESNRVRPADAARRVGPQLDEDADAQAPTPRHPEFEPRNHVAPPTDEIVEHQPTADYAPIVEHEPIPEATAAPWLEAETAEPPADLPWALPPLEPIAPQQPAPVQSAPPPVAQSYFPPESPAAPVDAWTVAAPVRDPLAMLPAATFAAPAAPVAQPVYTPQPEAAFAPTVPVVQPAVVQPVVVESAPVAQPAPALAPAVVAAAPARPAANAAQSDLWFLASEPDIAVAEEPSAEKKTGQPSNLLTMGLTVAMAIVVIVLVLVFIQLMTSLLR